MSQVSVGVVVCTYNGIKYLSEQLESIATQSFLPSVVIVSDDGSSDGTWGFLEEWAAKQTVIDTILIRNEAQLGVIKNFQQAALKLTTDIIFFSDQDDIWLADKIEAMVKVFEQNDNVLLVHSDSLLVDKSGLSLGTTLFQSLSVSDRERCAIHANEAFSVFLRRNIASGATMAFRKELLGLAGPAPHTYYHDEWLATVAAGLGQLALVDRPTIKYRQHGSNIVGAKKMGFASTVRHFWWDINKHNSRLSSTQTAMKKSEILYEYLSTTQSVSASHLKLAREALDFSRERTSLPKNPILRCFKIASYAAEKKYFRFLSGPKIEIVRDLINR